MSATVAPLLVERFRAVLSRQTGLAFDEQRLGFLGDVLMQRLARLGRSGEVYLAALEHGKLPDEIAVLARELTVPETYFFRHNDQFRALAERVMPERMRDGRPVRTLSILSAGCATGEEAYSLAIVFREAVDDPSWDIRIRAVDLSPASLEKAARGRYTAWSLRDTAPARRRRWFEEQGSELVLDESIRRSVRFEPRNLAVEDAELWSPGAYDVVFCRNVLMYFEPERMRQVIGRIARSLAPGGFLFLGHAETLRGVSEDFHLCHTHDAFYYQRKDVLHPPAEMPPPVSAPARVAAETVLRLDGAFVDVIRDASERVAALMPGASQVAAEQRWDAAPALDLLRGERFEEALEMVRARPAALARDPDLLLLEAMLLFGGGFNREALVGLCNLALKDCGGRA